MVRYESVITALIGAVMGAVLGVLFALVDLAAAGRRGLHALVPGRHAAHPARRSPALAGVLAAIGPARRASRLDVLEALAYE